MKTSDKAFLQEHCKKNGMEKFVEKAIHAKHSFCFSHEGYTYLCVPIPCGKATYIYGNCSSPEDFGKDSLNFRFWALIRDDQIYLMDWFVFRDSINIREELPSCMIKISDYVEKWRKKQDDLINECAKNLDLDQVHLSEDDEKVCQRTARHQLIYKEKIKNLVFSLVSRYLTTQDCIDHLCGCLDLESATKKIINDNIRILMHKVKMDSQIQKYMEEKKIVKEWELYLADACCGNEKNVTVVFKKNGSEAEIVMSTETLLYHLDNKEPLDRFDFSPCRRGDELFFDLGLLDDSDGQRLKEIRFILSNIQQKTTVNFSCPWMNASTFFDFDSYDISLSSHIFSYVRLCVVIRHILSPSLRLHLRLLR